MSDASEDGGGGAASASAAAEAKRLKKAVAPTREDILKGTVGRVGKKKKSGIVYISRIPPHLKPMRLKQMLGAHGKVDRVYLAPQVGSGKVGKNGKKQGKSYSEGWVEFVDKKMAKHVATLLNGEPMGGRKKRSKYYYDLWNLKYLSGFKWENLTEDIAYRKRVRDQKLAAEVSAAKKERDFYLNKVDQARVISEIEKRKKDAGGADMLRSIEEKRTVRNFPQSQARPDPVTDKKQRLSRSVLNFIGGKK
mmetsp:Transcript_12109/g.25777  ORF Transcript_12109/g.25777 Transcript_12109/m.25777 type:complete len:250 (-) Transcript_12109:96-845(-)